MKSHRITAGGSTTLHVVETGNPQGRPILFIHIHSWFFSMLDCLEPAVELGSGE
jgi:hypothetical protein